MIYHIKMTSAFERDLRQAASYISQKLYNPYAAERLVLMVRKAVESLKESPGRFPVVTMMNMKNWEFVKWWFRRIWFSMLCMKIQRLL